MTEAKHTEGPWDIKRAERMTDNAFDFGIVARINGKPQVIAEVFGRTDTNIWPNSEANAHLIAAAPDMKETLDAIKRQMEHSGGNLRPHEFQAVMYWLDKALAKAEGRTP